MSTFLRWRDVTTFSRSDTVREPRTYQLDVRGTRLIVTRHIDYPGRWCVEAHGEVRITIAPTDALTVEEAQQVAVARLRTVAQSILDALEAGRNVCHVERCTNTATHGPDGRAVACWAHAGEWPEVLR